MRSGLESESVRAGGSIWRGVGRSFFFRSACIRNVGDGWRSLRVVLRSGARVGSVSIGEAGRFVVCRCGGSAFRVASLGRGGALSSGLRFHCAGCGISETVLVVTGP